MSNKFLSEYNGVVTSDGRILEGSVRNVFDPDLGLVINELGARNNTEHFYREEYSLHEESADSQIADYENEMKVGISEVITDFIKESWRGHEKSRIIDVGCGKGLMLRNFREKFPDSELTGVEPSERARTMLSEDPALNEIRILSLDDVLRTDEKFDLLTINGVLEHVEDPEKFLLDLKSIISEEGVLFVGVPNFLANPLDLLTYDHLTRFTPNSLGELFNSVGFHPVASQVYDTRVAMWWLCEHASSAQNLENISNHQNDFSLVEKNQIWLDKCLREIPPKVKSAKSAGKPVVFYGTANLLPALLAQKACLPDDVDHIVDDNESYWGSERWGSKIESPEKVFSQDNFDPLVIISANPCYHERICDRANKLSQGKAEVLTFLI